MNDKFQKALNFTLKWEGGFSNHPNDLGGQTKFGITQSVYSSWLRSKGLPDVSVRQITKSEAEEIYLDLYWKKALCEELIDALAMVHFDTAVNFGVSGAFAFLEDTVGKFNDFGEVIEEHNTLETAIAYVKERIKFRHQRVAVRPDQRVFLEGWLNRDNDLLELIKIMNTKQQVLRIENNTWLKIKPLDSSRLTEREKLSIKQGDRFPVLEIKEERGHYKFKLNKPEIGNHVWYYVYRGHSRLEIPESDIPKKVTLEVPYLSQLDNFYNPTGACNVTSYAMVMKYLGIKSKDYPQLEDELYAFMQQKGLSRHSPYDLAKMGRGYGLNVDFQEFAKIEDVCEWLATQAIPVVIHGYFTGFGHIITVVGYDSNGLIVHDPYGEWFATGYRTDLPGAYLHYSYTLIRNTCIESDGSFWVHFISKQDGNSTI